MPTAPRRRYLLRIDVLEGMELPPPLYSDEGEGLIHIVIGQYFLKTSVVKYHNGRCEWYQSL
jgi:hypothetical protein